MWGARYEGVRVTFFLVCDDVRIGGCAVCQPLEFGVFGTEVQYCFVCRGVVGCGVLIGWLRLRFWYEFD